LVIAALLGLGAFAFFFDVFGLRANAELTRALTQRGRVAFVGDAFSSLSVDGTLLLPGSAMPTLSRALAADDEDALLQALDREHVQALLIEPARAGKGATLAARIGRFEHVRGLRGVFLAPGAALYAPDLAQQISAPERHALAVVARALLGGARRPKSSSFPETLRRLRPVEVMVLLRNHGEARLWRSARGSSLATALMVAATVARERWQEREQMMGAALDEVLPRLDVEVALLDDDGTLGEREPAFVDRVFFPEHGIGYERKGNWRYFLPEATHDAGHGHASQAYRKLFRDDGLPEDSLPRRDLRLYRLVVELLATSPASTEPDDGLSPVRAPEDVLGKPAK